MPGSLPSPEDRMLNIQQTLRPFARYALACAVSIMAVTQTAFADTEVNTCGQTAAGASHLSADLICTGMSGAAVILQPGATFDLRGHTLTSDAVGVYCDNTCTITSSVAGGAIRDTPAAIERNFSFAYL